MANYMVIDTTSNTVNNIIIWDGVTPIDYPDTFELVIVPPNTSVSPGYLWSNGNPIPPPPDLSNPMNMAMQPPQTAQTLSSPLKKL